jgi:hypothetical protein
VYTEKETLTLNCRTYTCHLKYHVCNLLHAASRKLPGSCYLGPLAGAPELAAEALGAQARVRGSPFALVNGATASDAVVLFVPPGVQLDAAVHVLYISCSAGKCLCSGKEAMM